LKPRLPLADASRLGPSAALAVLRVARACNSRERAEASVGLTAWAASISSTSKGSFSCCHHWFRPCSEPWCGSGACHCVGAAMATAGGRAGMAQAASSSGTASVERRR